MPLLPTLTTVLRTYKASFIKPSQKTSGEEGTVITAFYRLSLSSHFMYRYVFDM